MKVGYEVINSLEGAEEITDFRQTSSCFNAHEVNPAIGCDFQCRYCSMYAQSDKEEHLPVKIFSDYPDYLRDYIRNCENKDKLIFNFTPKSDAFCDSMIESGMTERILKIFYEENVKYYILTKSTTPPKEIMDLLIKSKNKNQVIFSSGLLNEEIETLLEPGAPCSTKRMEFAKELIKNGVATSGIAAPYLPIEQDIYAYTILDKFKNAGINHVSVQILKVSVECLERMCKLMPKYEERIRELFNSEKVVPIQWRLPGGKVVTRFYADTTYIKEELIKVKKIATEKGMTISTCKDICINIGDHMFNKEAIERGYNCVGFTKWK